MTGERKALVTGATRGIGLQLARRLAAAGYALTLVARSADELAEVVKTLEGPGHEVVAVDLSDREAVGRLVRRVEASGFDLLVNNAGGTRFGAFESLTDAEVTAALDVNLVAPARLSRAFIRSAPPDALLVNVTSVVGGVPMPGNAVYSAAKAGAQALSECLWWELKDRPVRVMEYRPMSVRTGFHESAGGRPLNEPGAAMSAEDAAGAIMERIQSGRDFVQSPGVPARMLEALRRVLPRKLLLELLGRRAGRAGYLE